MRTRLLLGCIALLAAGCTLSGPSPTPSSDTQPTSTLASPSTPDVSRRQIEASLRTGRDAEALAVIRVERGRNRNAFTTEYLRALQSLTAAAERHLQKDELATAGKALQTVLDHYPEDTALARRVGRSRQELQKRLETCAARLMERGLGKYRMGDLQGAIDTWKQILLFQADHADARKIIQTADLQLKRLRTLP